MSILNALYSFLGFLAGLWGATYLQDRETRRRHLGIVRALRAELRRVYSEVGAKNDAYVAVSLFGANPIIPTLATWVQSLATDLASADAFFLERFMDLDRYLANLAAALPVERATIERVEHFKEAIAVHQKNKDAMAELVTKADLNKAEQSRDLASFTVQADFKNVKNALQVLDARLVAEESFLAMALRTHLPWKVRRASATYPDQMKVRLAE